MNPLYIIIGLVAFYLFTRSPGKAGAGNFNQAVGGDTKTPIGTKPQDQLSQEQQLQVKLAEIQAKSDMQTTTSVGKVFESAFGALGKIGSAFSPYTE